MTDQEKIAATAKLYPLPLTATVRAIHYGIADDGHVWIRAGNIVGIVEGAPLCSPFTIEARLDRSGGRGGIRVVIEDMTGKPKTVDIWRGTLKSRAETTGALVDGGMPLGSGGADIVMDILRSANPQKAIDWDAVRRAMPAKLAPAPQPKPAPQQASKPKAIREDAF
jgi:hypothetical protein